MTKFFLTGLLALFLSAAYSQSIERALIGSAGQTLSGGGFEVSFSVGEPVILPSPSQTFDVPTSPKMVTIGFIQPHIAQTGNLLHANNRVSAYPNPTTGRVRIDIHADNFQTNFVRIYNSSGIEVNTKPFVLVNGSIDLDLMGLPAGLYFISVTDKVTGNTVSTRILKQNK